MKAVMLAIPIVLCVLLLIVPIFELIGLINGLDFILHNELAIVITQTVLTVGATVALFVLKAEYGRTGRIFLMLLAPIALLNSLCFADCEWAYSIIFAVVWSVCAFVLYYRLVPDSAFKATSAVFSVLIALAFVGLYLWNLLYGSFINDRTVEATYTSMNGTYVAEVCTSKSLIGTKMTVYIAASDPKSENMLGYYQAKPAKIYEGEEHETKTASISWLDDETVIINDEAYRSVKNENE